MTGGTEKAFGYEWDHYREVVPLHRRQFEQWIQPVAVADFKGKSFLDAGCGTGRNSLWPLEAGAASGYAFDYDRRTVEVARENLKGYPNCRVGFESIYDIAMQDEFDIVFCIGVLHHLESPRAAVENLVRALKPGGKLVLWLYALEGNETYLLWADPLRKHVTCRLPPLVTRAIAIGLTAALKFYLRLPHRNAYLQELRRRSFRHTEAMVFDQLLPHIAHYFSRDEALALVRGLPLEDVLLTHTHGVSWSLVARKTVISDR